MGNLQGLVMRDHKWFFHFPFDGPEHVLTPDVRHVQKNLIEALLIRTTPHSRAPLMCHQTITGIPDPLLTWQLSPHLDCKASLSFRESSYAGTRCDTGNILMKGRHLAHPRPPQFFISAQESPQIPLHLAFWKLCFLQLKECLRRRLQIIFTPCAVRDADMTWHNARKEGMLRFPTRLILLLQVHWENPQTGHTNPSAFNSRELQLQQVIRSPFSQVSTVWLYYFTNTLKKPKTNPNQPARKAQRMEHHFVTQKNQLLLGAFTSEARRHKATAKFIQVTHKCQLLLEL